MQSNNLFFFSANYFFAGIGLAKQATVVLHDGKIVSSKLTLREDSKVLKYLFHDPILYKKYFTRLTSHSGRLAKISKGPVRYPQVEISQYAEARPHSDRHRLTLGSIPYRIGRKVRNRLTVMRGLSSKANIFPDLTKVMDPKQLKRDDDRSRNISSASYALALLL